MMTFEVYAEFIKAIAKTGETPALTKAGERLPVLLSMKPETVEAYSACQYAKL